MSTKPAQPLTSKTFSELGVTKKTVVSIPPQTTIENALKTMVRDSAFKTNNKLKPKKATNNVLTLPITSRAFPNKYVYILSTLDILLYVVSRQKAGGSLDLTATVESAMTMDAEQESYRVFERDYRDTIESTMLQFTQGLHRALITDALKTQPPIVLTQTDILSYIHKNICFKQKDKSILSLPCFGKTLAELGFVTNSVKGIREDESALDGFRKMAKGKVLAVPVLDKAGILVGTLSAEDLRGLSGETIGFVGETVVEFLNKMKTKSEQTVSLTPSDTLMDAINVLVEKDVHRLWIVDSMLRPIGVCSQSDVIAAILGVAVAKV
ncbi:UNVERIFIED_CONTAM: hypothetical protein HDU68_000584 [Siphonaria sp. JEL0065]|nr:hypothetical protein HDU68_000584 [Siphonaria sp. JEL0065]